MLRHWVNNHCSLISLGILLATAAGACAAAPALAQQVSEQEQQEQPLEVIYIRGHHYSPETLSVHGEYNLSRDYLNSLGKGNGNITDLLLGLPGVQGSEGALDAQLQGEIRSQLLSISGAQPWQTGYYFNGISNNSRLDPSSANAAVGQVNDVQGHPQASFINHLLVDNVTLYDSNVPAKFGGFTGGVVDVQPRAEAPQQAQFLLSYRASEASLNRYQLIDNRDYNDQADASDDAVLSSQLRQPDFSKRTLGLTAAAALGDDYAASLAVSRTTSAITEYSLQQPELTQRQSLSSYLSFTSYAWGFDQVRLSAGYSPYEGIHLLNNVQSSEFSSEGGGSNVAVHIEQQFDGVFLDSSLAYSASTNSRSAPNVFLPWYRAPGKDWGLNVGAQPFSSEGGYGDLDKDQRSLSWQAELDFDTWRWGSSEHHLSLGSQLNYVELTRSRRETGLVYNSPYRDANIDCAGNSIDCIEQAYRMPLSQLEQQLGEPLDLSKPAHLQAYTDNLVARGQFFRYRRVYPLEQIQVNLQEYSAYLQHQIAWRAAEFQLGLRADYDDFLQHLVVAPRFQAAFNLGTRQQSRLIMGLNRYYSANLLTYKIREQQRPYVTQYRSLSQGVVQDWVTSSQAQQYRYRYDQVETPYSDELTVALKQRLVQGVLSLKAVQRWNRQQLTRGDAVQLGQLTDIYQTNDGSGIHQRLTLSYQRQFGRHGLWLHTSYTHNENSADSYDDSIDAVPEDNIVFYQEPDANGDASYRLVSIDDLTRLQDDFSRPISASAAVTSTWSERFSSRVQLSYVGAYSSAEATGLYREFARGDEVCGDCQISNLSYPVYSRTERPARTLVDATLQYQVPLNSQHQLTFSIEINNLLNQRTYAIGSHGAGYETGRAFWFGVDYAWH
ncbi:MAG: TonB-dependent receptor plug domain-containing protein [Pseudidiomarina maritima]|nr:TonB-dependent receptor plug domain-containing protein [Pseudidiomarina maritima]